MYKESKEPFEVVKFRAPAKEYRAAPFWAWTGKPEKNVMEEQVSEFREMGFGGFFIHSRVGLNVEYLGKEFLEDIDFCREKAEEQNLQTFLYDEDKWPSGFGGGRVTEDQQYASSYLLLSPIKYCSNHVSRQAKGHTRLTDSGKITLLKTFSLTLENGKLVSYREYKEENNHSKPDTWYLYLVISDCLDWFNGKQYANLLNIGTACRFLKVTYEKYYKKLGKYFGNSIPAIFTDEPSIKRYETMENSLCPTEVGFPYSDDVEKMYLKRYGESFLEKTPELIFNCTGKNISEVRYRYFEICSELFSENFIGTIASWCREKGIAYTGHFQDEDSLTLQAKACGDIMRAMAHLDIPGIDILADRHEYFALKQAQSIARQFGKDGQSAELYGVTNWDFDLMSHKHQGDWVAALGTTLRVPHLAWMSMKGEMKRDFPASINHCSPWYKKYKLLEDHYARLCFALTRGRPVVDVAVLNPVESAWMLLGPDNEQEDLRNSLEEHFNSLCRNLLFGQMDFDLINEALIRDNAFVENGKLCVGEMAYRTVIIPQIITIRSSTICLLRTFARAGGKVFFLGDTPEYIDGLSANEIGENLFSEFELVSHDEKELLQELEENRRIRINGSSKFLYQLREEDDSSWLFIAHGQKDSDSSDIVEIVIKGSFIAELYDTVTGEIRSLSPKIENGYTTISYTLCQDDSLLFRLWPSQKVDKICSVTTEDHTYKEAWKPVVVPEKVHFQIEETNVLVLDMATFSCDNGERQNTEEILRIDDLLRAELGYPKRNGGFLQPWLVKDKSTPHKVKLWCSFGSEIETEAKLAVEVMDDWIVKFNGTPVNISNREWYVDRCLKISDSIHIQKGENTVFIELPYGVYSDLENIYLLGDFGVSLDGSGKDATVVDQVKTLTFASITDQRMPFYGGNIIYSFDIATHLPDVEIGLPDFAGAIADISLDGKTLSILTESKTAKFTSVLPGIHRCEIKIYGNRINTFGPLHNCTKEKWCVGSSSFRTKGKDWSYSYQVKPFGLLAPPEIREG